MNRKSSIVNRQWQGAILGVILLAFAVLFPPYDWSFVGDDFVQFRYVWQFMERPFTAISLLNPYTLPWYYRPLQNYWFLSNRLTFGFNPFPYYAILGTFHALAISLVYRTSRQLRLSPLAAFCAAALFGIHAHWVDVVGWLSSVAIVLAAVFNLAAVSAYLTYLSKRKAATDPSPNVHLYSLPLAPHFWLGLTAFFFLLALITHEETIILPLMLLVIRLLNRQSAGQPSQRKLPTTKHEIALFIIMFLLTAVYLYAQFTRPNLTLEAQEIGLSGYLSPVTVPEIGRFVTDTLARFSLAFNLLKLPDLSIVILGLISLSLLLMWAFYGGRIVRIGLTWAFLHLTFIYFALWTQKPELYAGRHIYQAGLGLVWAIGASVHWWEQRNASSQGRRTRSQRRKTKARLRLHASAPLLLLTAVLLLQFNIINNTQANWLLRAQRYRRAEAQVKEMLPDVNANTTVLAHRFPITPSFLPATIQVWYETTINTAVVGGLSQLQEAEPATPDYYLFDYQDGNVVNLMPELQEHAETLFLWSQDGRLEQINPQSQVVQQRDSDLTLAVAGPEDDLRVSVIPPALETPTTWNSLIYPIRIPSNSQLQFSFFAQDAEAAFRVRLLGRGSEWETLLETTIPTPNQWTDITLPMPDHAEQSVIFRLESTKDGIWGNPRLTSD